MSLQDEHDIATKRPDVKEAYIKLTDAITGARTSMTDQGKPDRCRSEKHSPYFYRWLEMMDEAYNVLTPKAFRRLEDRIKEQMAYSRAELAKKGLL